MNLIKYLALFLFVFGVTIGHGQSVVIIKSDVIETRNGKSYYLHTVQKGQTVYSISRAYDVTPDEIYFENPTSKQGIAINQTLLIPTVNKNTELTNEINTAKFDFFYHVAANNETYSDISSIYLIPEKYIIKANPKLSPPFREGEYVKIPVEDAFDILDGKVSASNTVNTNIETYKPTPPTYQRPKSSTSNQPKPSVRDQETKSVTRKPKPQTNTIVTKPKTEFVSFDPNIPVIQDYRHVVILGETTQSIAEKYNVPVDLLKAANPGLGNSVAKGDRLRVPDKTKINLNTEKSQAKGTEENADSKPETVLPVGNDDTTDVKSQAKDNSESLKHKVKKKETLYSISREYGLTVDELIDANPGLTSTIKIGQIIIVPKKKITFPYIVYRADKTIKTSKLAKLYRIPTYQIKEFNPEVGNRIYKNQDIKIPVGSMAVIVPLIPDKDINNKITPEDPTVVDKPVESPCFESPNLNKTYKVALMIPLSLEEADSLNREHFYLSPQPYFKPFRFIKFYEGALMALDSLKNQGMNVEFYVYDVDKEIPKTIKVLSQPELRHMDLIIGPFFTSSFNQVAQYAGNFDIPIINPLSYREEVVNNYKTVFKVRPNKYAQIELIEPFVNNYARDSKVFLISQTSYLDADLVTNIKNKLLQIADSQIKVSNYELMQLSYDVALRDTLYNIDSTPPPFIFENTEIYPEILEANLEDSTVINNTLIKINYSVDSLYPFIENASPIRNNIVFLYGNKKSFILDVLNRINETRDTFNIQLIGMPTWERINNLNNIKMNNLNTTYFASDYIDFNDDKIQDFIYNFRSNYNSEPDNYAFTGFDITYYFLSALFYLDSNFGECIEQYKMELIQGNYNFQRVGNSNNFTNTYWHMLKLRNLQESKISDDILLLDDINKENENY